MSSALTVIALTLIVGFGSMLRFQAFSESVLDEYPRADAARFLVYAYNLKNFGIYSRSDYTLIPADTDIATAREIIQPDGLVAPGYAFFLSRFLGGDYTEKQRDSIVLTQVILSSLTILLAYFAFAQMSSLLGLGVAALTALSPHLVNMNLFLLSETLFCFLLIGFVWLLGFIRKGTNWPLFLMIGLVFAMASLTRSWIQAYLFILVPFLVFSHARIPFRRALVTFIGAAILFAPWMIRNEIFLETTADPSHAVISLHHGMYPDMMYEDQPESFGYAYNYDPKSPELGKSISTTLAELKTRASEQPAKYLRWYLYGKAQLVLSWKMIAAADATFIYPVKNNPYFSDPAFYLSSYYMEQIHGLLMVLAVAGTLLVWLPARLQLLSENGLVLARALSLLVLYFLAAHSVVAPYPRYSIPMRPVLYAMSLFPLVFIAHFIKRRVTHEKGHTPATS